MEYDSRHATVYINGVFAMTQILRALFITIFLSLTLSACVYRINVQQGNIITDEAVAKIHTGMNTEDVKALFGEPLLNNVYHNNHMIYVYTMRQGHHPMARRNLNIYFVHDKVTGFSTTQ